MGHTFVFSLLLQLLWYIGGSPPVLCDREELWQRKCYTNNIITSYLPFPIFYFLCQDFKYFRTALISILLLVTTLGDACDPWSHDQEWLSDPQTQHDLLSSDLVATARVVSRSRSTHGRYSATFMLEKIMKVRNDVHNYIFNEKLSIF